MHAHTSSPGPDETRLDRPIPPPIPVHCPCPGACTGSLRAARQADRAGEVTLECDVCRCFYRALALSEVEAEADPLPATPPAPVALARAVEPVGMTPKVLAAVIGTTALASLVQVEIYLPRKHWWRRRERVSPEALAKAIGNNAAMAVAIDDAE